MLAATIADEVWREGVLACRVNATVDGAGGGWHHLTTAATGTGPERRALRPERTRTYHTHYQRSVVRAQNSAGAEPEQPHPA